MSTRSSGNGGEDMGCLWLVILVLAFYSCQQQDRIEKLEKPTRTMGSPVNPALQLTQPLYGPYETPQMAEALARFAAPKRSYYYYGPYEMPPNYGYLGYLER